MPHSSKTNSELNFEFIIDDGQQGYLRCCEALLDVEIIIIGFVLFSSA